jgi:mannose/fructose/N-acetylgalactosamine-specific phosphotransferase system component IIB
MEFGNFVFRVDDRLIHGQVNVGWLQPLSLKNAYVVNDAAASDSLAIHLWRIAIPDGIRLFVYNVKEFIEKKDTDLSSSILIVGGLADAYTILSSVKIPFKNITIGGLHYKKDAMEIFPYLSLSKADIELLQKILDMNISISIRVLYNSKQIKINDEFLRGIREKIK